MSAPTLNTSNPLTVGLVGAYSFAYSVPGQPLDNSVLLDGTQTYTASLGLVSGGWGDGAGFDSGNPINYTGSASLLPAAGDTEGVVGYWFNDSSAPSAAFDTLNGNPGFGGNLWGLGADTRYRFTSSGALSRADTADLSVAHSFIAGVNSHGGADARSARAYLNGALSETSALSAFDPYTPAGNMSVSAQTAGSLAHLLFYSDNPVQLSEADYVDLNSGVADLFESDQITAQAIGVITGVVAKRQSTDKSTLITWDEDPDSVTYEVEFQFVGEVDQWQTLVVSSTVGTRWWHHYDGGAQREYRVRGKDGGTFGDWSAVTQETLQDVRVTWVSATRNTIEWDAVTDATSYIIEYRDITGSGAWTELATTSQLSYTDNKPNENRRAYRVTAVTGGGNVGPTEVGYEIRPYRLRQQGNDTWVEVPTISWSQTNVGNQHEFYIDWDGEGSGAIRNIWGSINNSVNRVLKLEGDNYSSYRGALVGSILPVPANVETFFYEEAVSNTNPRYRVESGNNYQFINGNAQAASGLVIGHALPNGVPINGVIQHLRLYTNNVLQHWWVLDDNALDGGQIDDLVGDAHGTLILGSGEWFGGPVGPPPPGQVTGVTATRQAGDVSTLIEWQLEPDAVTYEVQQQLVGDTDQWQVVAAAVVGTSFTDNHAGGARREYRVRAENATDIGPWSDVAQETLLPVELPGQVDGVGSVSGSPEVSRLLSGQVDGVGAVSGSPEVSSSLSGRVDGVGAVSGSPEVSRLLSGQVDGEGSVAGSPEVSRLLSGQVDGVGSVEGEPSLDTTVWLAGQVDGVGSVSGLPEVLRLLSGQADGVGAVAGSPQVTRLLSGQVDGVGSVWGAPVVVGDQVLCGPTWEYSNPRTWGITCVQKS